MDDSAQTKTQLEEISSRLKEHDRRFDEHDRQFKELRQEIQDFRQEIRQELRDEIRGLHVRFEGLQDTMRLVAERVSDFNREGEAVRSRVSRLENVQATTDLRLVALERKKRKS